LDILETMIRVEDERDRALGTAARLLQNGLNAAAEKLAVNERRPRSITEPAALHRKERLRRGAVPGRGNAVVGGASSKKSYAACEPRANAIAS